ncbi:hypothetical protein MOSE0_L05688 [Monosporozyma servazzii]
MSETNSNSSDFIHSMPSREECISIVKGVLTELDKFIQKEGDRQYFKLYASWKEDQQRLEKMRKESREKDDELNKVYIEKYEALIEERKRHMEEIMEVDEYARKKRHKVWDLEEQLDVANEEIRRLKRSLREHEDTPH